MRSSFPRFLWLMTGLAATLAWSRASAEEKPTKPEPPAPTSTTARKSAAPASPATRGDTAKSERGDKANANAKAENVLEVNMLDAMRKHQISVSAEGNDDGRLIVSVTNHTHRKLRVVLPPGIVAQNAVGQMGGMMGGMGGMGMGGGMMGGMGMGGGMGGGMMGGGMRGGMMGGGMGSRIMPPMMGLMTLGRIIMYFCGDYDSWDMRSLMISMGMRGGMMGGMGMGGGMMGGGGMGGMMGGMGGMGGMGMMSVPATGLPTTDLKPKQTRHLPTRYISMMRATDRGAVQLPRKGERFRVGDVRQVSDNPLVQKGLERLAASTVSSRISQLVMWNLTGGMDWDAIARLSRRWANDHERTMARSFVERLDTLAEGESGRLYFELTGADASSAELARRVTKILDGKLALGLRATRGIPSEPSGPAVAVRVRLQGGQATAHVESSDSAGRAWVPFGKYEIPIKEIAADAKTTVADAKTTAASAEKPAIDPAVADLGDAMVEGLMERLVRVQLVKGPRVKDHPTYLLRIDNASPFILEGLAALGIESGEKEAPRVLNGISVSPWRKMRAPVGEAVVRKLGLKHGIRLIALNLSGL